MNEGSLVLIEVSRHDSVELESLGEELLDLVNVDSSLLSSEALEGLSDDVRL